MPCQVQKVKGFVQRNESMPWVLLVSLWLLFCEEVRKGYRWKQIGIYIAVVQEHVEWQQQRDGQNLDVGGANKICRTSGVGHESRGRGKLNSKVFYLSNWKDGYPIT